MTVFSSGTGLRIQTRFRRALAIITSLTLLVSAISWVVLSITEGRLERHLAQSLSDLGQITSLVSKSVLLAAKASGANSDQSLARLLDEQRAFTRDLNEFLLLAERLPRPSSSENFDMSEVPSIVRVVHRLDATTRSLFAVTGESSTLRLALDERRRRVSAAITTIPSRTARTAETLRVVSDALSSSDIATLGRLERRFLKLSTPKGDPALAQLTDVFSLKRQELGMRDRLNATTAMVDVAFGQLTAMIGGLSSQVETSALQRGNEMLNLMRTSKGVLIAGALASLGVGLLVSTYSIQTIIASLVRATNAIRRLAEGDDTAELPGQDRGDEIGDLANAFAIFKANALERNHLIQQVERDAQLRLGILNGLEEGVALFDRDGRIVAWNPRFLTLSGLATEEVIAGFRLSRLLSTLDAEVNLSNPLKTECQLSDGRTIELKLGTMPSGGTLATLVDLTDRKMMERRLRQGQQMEALGQLTGGIAHDFNNLLAAVSSNLQLIQDQAAENTGTLVRAGRALVAVENGTAMVQRLLAFARKQPLHPELVDINELIRNLVDLIELSIDPAIVLTTELAENLPTVVIDPGQMESAVLNLIFNARDAISAQGEIVVSTKSLSAGTTELTVRDTGGGMAPDVVARAFDPFFTTKPFGLGSGLGLSTVFGFIRQSGGQVTITSEVGEGTTVRIELPAAQSKVVVAVPKMLTISPPIKPERVLRILIVEDDDILRATTQDMIESLGHEAVTVASGTLALQRLREQTFDVMFSDVVLGRGEDGRTLAEAAQEDFAELVIILSTGYTAKNMDIAEQAGFPVLKKPYSRAELCQAILTAARRSPSDPRTASTSAAKV